jgi:hypothetical protein
MNFFNNPYMQKQTVKVLAFKEEDKVNENYHNQKFENESIVSKNKTIYLKNSNSIFKTIYQFLLLNETY